MLHTLLLPHFWLNTLFAFMFGAVIGSFVNVVIDRYPKIMQREVNDAVAAMTNHLIPPELSCFYDHEVEATKEPYSLAFPGSHCDSCLHPLSWYENVPILGWVFLKGRCRTCGAIIPARVPLVELLCAGYAASVVWFYGMSFFAVMACLLLFIALTVAMIDMDTLELPDPMVYTLLWTGLIFCAGGVSQVPLQTAVVNAVFIYCLLWSVECLMPGKLGVGDVKLMAAFSVYLTFHHAVYLLVASCVLGLVFVLGGRLLNWMSDGKICSRISSLKVRFPFGPAICLAGLSLFWWQCLQ